jgi:hypothetical protein
LRGRDYSGGILLSAILTVLAGLAPLFLSVRQTRRQQRRVSSLTGYLSQVNAGEYHLRPTIY